MTYLRMLQSRAALTAAACLFAAATALSSSAQTTPTAPASAPATATAPAPRPTADSLIPPTRAPFEFANTPIADMIAMVSRTWDLHIIDSFKLTDRITVKIPGELTGREAINLIDETLLPLGYTMVEEVKGEPPLLVLRVTPVSRELGLPVFTDSDPGHIPETDELRTQVFILRSADPQKTREMILPVLDKKSDVVINAAQHALIVTDTAARLHTAAVLIQVLEKQAAATSAPSPQP